MQSRKDQKAIRDYYSKKEFSKGLDYLKSSALSRDKKQRLLFLMEKGLFEYSSKDYTQACVTFDQANELVDLLYTKSIKEKIASSILSDNSETYYGEIFERSMLYYYGALSFYRLAKRGFYYEVKKDGKKEKIEFTSAQVKQNIDRSRSMLVAWDSFYKDLQRSDAPSLLSHSYFYKVFAANMHRAYETRKDDDVALILYQDALDILKKSSKNYLSFDTKADPNRLSQIEDSLKIKILSLTKKNRSYRFSRVKKELKASKELVAKSQLKSNAVFQIELGQIEELIGRDASYTLAAAIKNIESPATRSIVNGIGVPILTYFAMGPLGLGVVSHHGDVSVYSGHNAGTSLVKEVGIEFELPFRKGSKLQNNYYLEFYQENKLIERTNLVLEGPINETAKLSIDQRVESSFPKRAARIGTKYVAAIAASFATYNKLKDSGSELFARPAALAQFVLVSKGIKETEKADTRHWTNLPGYILSSELLLKPGEYDVKFIEESQSENKEIRRLNLGSSKVGDTQMELFSYRVN